MKNYEALKTAIAGNTVEHAKELGLSTIMVNKWQEPHVDYTDSGAYNPLDRIETIVDKALRIGTPWEAALAPVYRLNHRFGLVAFAMPQGTGDLVSQELVNTIKEFSDLAQATSAALAAGKIDRRIEAGKIIKEGEEALRAIGALLELVKEQVK